MVCRVSGAFLLMVVLGAAAASADDDLLPLAETSASSVVPSPERSVAPTSPEPAAPVETNRAPSGVRFGGPRRGALLPSLYVGLAGLNAFDPYATMKGLSNGAVEANPVVRGLSDSAPVFWAVKGAVTAGSIIVAERLWKSRRRGRAVGVMIVTNGIMAAVAARNARVLRGR
jgi:hypothetical protein